MSEVFLNRYVDGQLETYFSNPVTLDTDIVNLGTYSDAVYGKAIAWQLTNLGTIGQVGAGSLFGTGNGVALGAGGTVINGQPGTSAYIYSAAGGDGVAITNGAGTVKNSGTITSTDPNSQGLGVFLGDSGVVENGLGGATGATIKTASDWPTVEIYGSFGTVVNAGTITGGDGISLGNVFDPIAGTVTNEQSGYINGHESGVYINDATATVTNEGTIEGYRQGGVIITGGTVTNGSTADTSALIAGGRGVKGGNVTITNYGTIDANGNFAARGNAVYIGSGTIFNGEHGLITGYNDGIFSGDTATVSNFGSVVASHANGIGFNSSGNVYNAISASISGVYNGVAIGGGPSTLINDGRIQGGAGAFETGVQIDGDAKVVNGSSSDTTAYIGGNDGLDIAAGTVSNYGTIVSTAGSRGIWLQNAGSIGNGASGSASAFIQGGIGVVLYTGTLTNFGTIEGSTGLGVQVQDGGTLTNAGTISGANGTAVQFGGSGGDRLVVDPGAVFVGQVSGAGTSDTIELAGTAAGTITGIGTSFVGFGTVDIDPGAKWTLVSSEPSAGLLFGGDTVSGFGTSDKIDLTGIGDNSASATIVGSQLQIIDNAQTFLVNLANPSSYTGDTFIVTADSSTGILVGFTTPSNPNQVPSSNIELDSTANDTVNANSGNDTIGTFGIGDVVNAGPGANVVSIFGADSTVIGGSGPDTIDAYGPNAVVDGAGGNDVIGAYGADDTIVGGTGVDTVNAYAQDDSITGGSGPDIIGIYGGSDTVSAGSGNDTITVYSAGDRIAAGSGVDQIDLYGNNDTVTGGSGPDTITVFGQGDQITGAGGTDVIALYGNDDTITGGAGLDTISAIGNSDAIAGGTGAATIDVSGNQDTVSTGSGPETITVGGSNDTIQAGALGNTTIANIMLSGSGMVFADGAHTYADTVTGFSQSAGDKIELSGAGHTVAASAQVNGGADTLITLSSGSTILLKGVTHIDNSIFS